MTDTETSAAGAKTKKPRSPEKEADRKVNRALARALARIDSTGGSNKKTQFSENRADYMAKGKKLASALKKEGVTIAVDPSAPDSDA